MEVVFKSLVAAVITGAILVLSKFVGPKMAGALGGIPIVFAISYVLITMTDKSVANNFLIGGIYGAVAAIFFSLVLVFFNNKFPNTHWINFATAYALCFALAFGMAHFTTK